MMRRYLGAPLFMNRSHSEFYSFADTFAQMIARKAPNLNILAKPGDRIVDHIRDVLVRIFDK